MKFRRLVPALLGSAALLVPFAAAAQQPLTAPAAASPNDRAFITGMLQESRDQIALARLAVRRATGAEAISAANEGLSEWSSLRSRLTGIAYAQGAPVRGSLDDAGRTMLDRLGRTPPARFDVAYLRDEQQGNQRALARIRHEENTTDSRLERFVAYARPVVSRDEQMTSDDLLGNSRPG